MTDEQLANIEAEIDEPEPYCIDDVRHRCHDLIAEVRRLQAQLVAMDAKLIDANPEIKRLRDLVAAGCCAGEDLDECPWCVYRHSEERNARGGSRVHALDCPAFTPDGKVR